jgi:predicted heme/steroid binding protein
MNKFPFVKGDRVAAWILFFTIIAYGITGFGMTKGFIPHTIATQLHLGWLGAIGLVAFITHTSWAIHLFLIRHRIWNKWTKIALPLFYIVLAVVLIWLQFFFTMPTANTKPSVPTPASSASLSNANSSSTTIFTAKTLETFNGLNGQPAYAAIDGVVYDMSKVFRNGTHHGHSAGQDLTDAFHGQHPADYLNGLPIVGTYTK